VVLFGVSVDDEAVAAVDIGGISIGAVSNHVSVVTGAEMADGSIVGTGAEVDNVGTGAEVDNVGTGAEVDNVGTGAEVDNVGTATATVVLGTSEISSSP
jgi:hypothetical protein